MCLSIDVCVCELDAFNIVFDRRKTISFCDRKLVDNYLIDLWISPLE